MAGAAIAGAQSRHLISTIKHFALNDQETDRVVLDVADRSGRRRASRIFSLSRSRSSAGGPGAVMCAYNQVNGVYSCENDWLLNQVLKGDWRYPGFVMSDWGAVHSTVRSALAGLDQESGEQLDTQNFFDRLGRAIADGDVPQARLDDMARRILTSIFACGLADGQVASDPADLAIATTTALADRTGRRGASCATKACCRSRRICERILVVGAHADRGVPSGGGSSQVAPRGGIAFKEPEGREPGDDVRSLVAARRDPPANSRAPESTIDDGRNAGAGGEGRQAADAVIVFADQYLTETIDAPNLEPAARAGCADRAPRAGQSSHCGRARNGRAGSHALARPDGRRHRGLVSRARRAAKRSPTSCPAPSTRPVGCRSPSRRAKRSCPTRKSRAIRRARQSGPSVVAGAIAGRSSPTTAKARRSATSGFATRRTAAVSIRLRPILYDVRSHNLAVSRAAASCRRA